MNPTVPLYTSAPAPVVYPSSSSYAPVAMEFGRVTNIEYVPGGGSRSGVNVPGAVLGAVAGAVLGNQIGSGGGRDAATVLGGAAGAAVGSQVGRTNTVTESATTAALWLGPGSWLVVSGSAPLGDYAAARDALNAAGGALFDG